MSFDEKHTNDFKYIYMKNFENYTNSDELVKHRHKIKNYLHQLYQGVF